MPKVVTHDDDDYGDPRRSDVSVSSVVFGLMIILALVVAAAAWMGGSMAKVEAGVGNVLDSVARTTGLAVSSVTVIGLDADPVLREQVLATAMIEPGENMWRADPHSIRDRIEATGRVVNVTVHRLWPDQVVITAHPATPTALWHDGEDWQVVDGLGRVMTGERPADHAGLLRVSGEGAAAAMPALREALAAAPSLMGRVGIAQRVDARRWDLLLDSGLVVRLPGETRLAAALGRFEALNQAEQLADRPLRLADFRLPGRVFLRPAGPASRHPGLRTTEGAA